MRLARITLCGFKSFADKQEIDFDAPVTGIVGPNGCGKSNVVDAIKWVLGSLSPKSLRGGAMVDMIFNGSATRKPSGMAYVTLTFGNEPTGDGRRTLPVDTDEVAVTRQLYRDGTSEYLINNKRARLRDIKELFMDTGVGTEAYSIIEQGKVDQLLQANAQQRRDIFEEAAGISKFKARKVEAQRKLERIESNLDLTRTRLEDIQKRLRSVKIQAGRARTFKEYDARLRELRMSYGLAEFHKLNEQLKQVADAIEQAEADRQHASRKFEEHQESLADAQSQRQAIVSEQKQIDEQRMAAASRKQQAEQREQFAARTLDDLRKRIEQDEQRLQELADRSKQLADDLAEQQGTVEKLTADQREAEQRLDEAVTEQRDIQHELNEKQSTLGDVKDGIVSLMRRAAELNNQISSLDALSQNLVSNREKLDERSGQIAEELERLLSLRDEAEEKKVEADELIAQQSAKLDELKQQSSQLDADQRQLSEKLAEVLHA